MSAITCPDCGRERGESGCRHWMDCMNSMRAQLAAALAKVADQSKSISYLLECQAESLTENTALRAKVAELEQENARLRRVYESDREIVTMLHSDTKLQQAEIGKLRQELADVHALDSSGHGWQMRDSSPGCEEVCYVPAVRSDGWYAPHGQHAAARRAAVEFLKKEGKDG